MPLRLLRPGIFERYRARLQTGGEPELVAPGFSELVVPVLDIDSFDRTSFVGTVTKDLSAAAGTHTDFFTVATGYRSMFKFIQRDATAAVSRLTARTGPTSGDVVYLTASATGEQIITYTFELEEGMSLGMLTTGNAGDTAITLRMLRTDYWK